MPGARMRCTVTIKFNPVKIELKPATKIARPVVTTLVFEKCVDIGVVNVQPVSTPPAIIAVSVIAPPTRYRYQLSRLILGKARSLAPTMMGIRKLPSVAGTDGTRNRKTMMMPCIVKNLLYVSDDTRSGCG